MYNVLYTVLSDTSFGQFVPVATDYPPRTDHLSNTTAIYGCRLVCKRPRRRCRMILLPSGEIAAAFRPPSLSSVSTPPDPSTTARNLPLCICLPLPVLLPLCSFIFFSQSNSPPRLFAALFFVPKHRTLALNTVLIGFPLCSLTLL